MADIDKNNRIAGRYWFGAGSGSKWYFLFNASEVIGELEALNAEGKVCPLLSPPHTAIGQVLQFLREISDPSPLIDHAARVDQMAPDFISYRMVDGTRLAFELVKLLLQNKHAVFWDRWSLPRRLAERNQSVAPEALDSHIASMIRTARVVWGVSSDLYGVDGSYSKLEKQLADEVGNFRPYPP